MSFNYHAALAVLEILALAGVSVLVFACIKFSEKYGLTKGLTVLVLVLLLLIFLAVGFSVK